MNTAKINFVDISVNGCKTDGIPEDLTDVRSISVTFRNSSDQAEFMARFPKSGQPRKAEILMTIDSVSGSYPYCEIKTAFPTNYGSGKANGTIKTEGNQSGAKRVAMMANRVREAMAD